MNIYLPDSIKVGFQERKDTYTGKLGYVIAKEGDKWRKEHSWNGWITHYKEKVEKKYRETSDESFKPVIYKNELTEGFVLNKKAGGKGWSSRNIRRTVCRVYDPRGFEFEIGIDNLLWILENTNSIIGKGLEGKFCYGWWGKNLWLIPENCEDYQKMNTFTYNRKGRIYKKDMEEGYIYLDKNMNELTYMGRFDTYDYKWVKNPEFKGTYQYDYNGEPREIKENVVKKKHWFCIGGFFSQKSGFTHLTNKVAYNDKYPDLIEEMKHNGKFSPYERSEFKYTKRKKVKYIFSWYFIKINDVYYELNITSYDVNKPLRVWQRELLKLPVLPKTNEAFIDFINRMGGVYEQEEIQYLKNGRIKKYN